MIGYYSESSMAKDTNLSLSMLLKTNTSLIVSKNQLTKIIRER
ncbi:hypothetical protein STRSA0001_0271 [Streptococcus salivarius SK126]|jgi:hypothetical protein|nr:hypothetical protein STRSA0001_0271 [Streptococcus salivarius SK126]